MILNIIFIKKSAVDIVFYICLSYVESYPFHQKTRTSTTISQILLRPIVLEVNR